jgi:hypothetical protein
MTSTLILEIVLAASSSVFLGHLIYAELNPDKHKSASAKHIKNVGSDSIYSKIYSKSFLQIWGLFAVSFWIQLIYQLCLKIHGHVGMIITTSVLSALLLIGFVIMSISLRMFKR